MPPDREGRFTTGSTMRHVVVMTTTASVGFVFLFLVDFLTLFYVSLLRDVRLVAGVGLASFVQHVVSAVAIGLAVAATALVSQALGARDHTLARSRTTSCLTDLFPDPHGPRRAGLRLPRGGGGTADGAGPGNGGRQPLPGVDPPVASGPGTWHQHRGDPPRRRRRPARPHRDGGRRRRRVRAGSAGDPGAGARRGRRGLGARLLPDRDRTRGTSLRGEDPRAGRPAPCWWERSTTSAPSSPWAGQQYSPNCPRLPASCCWPPGSGVSATARSLAGRW